jgi:hypothetical protein
MRRIVIASAALALVAGAGALGYVAYDRYFRADPVRDAPAFHDNPSVPLAREDEFEKLAKTDPVAMLAQCLSRYTREVKAAHMTLEKQERILGKPKPPEAPPVEVIDVWVRGDVPAPGTDKTQIEVQMKWKQGAKRPSIGFGPEIRASLFSERPKSEGGYDGKVVTYPALFGSDVSKPMAPNIELAKGQSRYCIRDAGLYSSMLRTHDAWKKHKDEGTLTTEYLGKKTLPQIGRECFAIKRLCPRTEIDAFEVGGKPSEDPHAIATEGFTEVTIYIDAERWIQVGSELYRTEPDGTRVLVGNYYMRDVELNPAIPADAFTPAALKK